MMLGVGYTLSAASPFLLGVVRDTADSYTPVLWCLAAAAAALVVVDGSLRLARPPHRRADARLPVPGDG
jgi:cyanate permease